MLTLRRAEGQWVEIKHVASGDVIRFLVYQLTGETNRQAHLSFEDVAHNFDIQRPERPRKQTAEAQ
jgi:hypothetical protein